MGRVYERRTEWIGKTSVYATYAVFRVPLRLLPGKPNAFKVEKVEGDTIVIRVLDWAR